MTKIRMRQIGTTIPDYVWEYCDKRGIKWQHLCMEGYNAITGKNELVEAIKTLRDEVKKRDELLTVWKKKVNRLEQKAYGGDEIEADEHRSVLGGVEPRAEEPDQGQGI